MNVLFIRHLLSAFCLLVISGCAMFNPVPVIPTSTDSVVAGTTVTRAGEPQNLLGDPVAVGQLLPELNLTDRSMSLLSLAELRGKIAVLSIAPSLDTDVCERQTHILGEASEEELPAEIVRVKITRDLPFAHSRFREHTGFRNILFLSDYKSAEFGLGTGLLMEDLRLLARAVMVVDAEGVIRYMQVVPEVGHLPDMEKAFAVARQLTAK